MRYLGSSSDLRSTVFHGGRFATGRWTRCSHRETPGGGMVQRHTHFSDYVRHRWRYGGAISGDLQRCREWVRRAWKLISIEGFSLSFVIRTHPVRIFYFSHVTLTRSILMGRVCVALQRREKGRWPCLEMTGTESWEKGEGGAAAAGTITHAK